MEDRTLAAFIDQYLMGTISPQDKSHLEHLMNTDPSVAEEVRDSQMAFKALQLEQHRRLKEKLRALDKDDVKRQGFYSSRSGILTFSLVALFLLYYLASSHYSVESIAGRNLERYPITGLPVQGHEEITALWKDAERAFHTGEYEYAILRYKSLSDLTDSDPANVAKWNLLMARLAVEGPTPSWKHSLALFRHETPGFLGTRAQKVSGMLDSAFGRFFTRQFQENFSSIKPRLI